MNERRAEFMGSPGPDWEAQFEAAMREWSLLNAAMPLAVGPDEQLFETIRDDASEIRARGGWVSGPADLLSVLGRSRNELFHSKVLSWLMNPTGRHGLGDAFLRAFLAKLWPGESFATTHPLIELERSRSGVSAVTGLPVEARADLVITFESLVLVIENKLDAGEQADQCERLYWPWAEDSIETRWIFLTPSGREPVTATSDMARSAWRSIGYHDVRAALETAIAAAHESRSIGRSTADQYLATLIESLKA